MLGALEGFTIGVTADRRCEEQALLLERAGATVVRGPCIRTLPLGDADELRAATVSLLAHPPDVLVANTAIGMRGWFEAAASWDMDDDLVQALSQSRVLARGPKVAGAVTTVGLKVAWRAPSEQLAEVAAHLARTDLRGQRVALQLHGDRAEPVTTAARAAGAEVVPIPVYRWDRPVDLSATASLVAAVADARVDAVTFTATPAVRTFFAVAEELGCRAQVDAALRGRVVVACVGPVCGRAAVAHGVDDPVVPARARLGSMVRALAERLGRRRIVLPQPAASGFDLTLQGSAVLVAGSAVRLTERERGLFDALASRPGAVVPRSALLQQVWGGESTDPHVLDVTVGRLRRKLGPAGGMISTVVRRGYRLDVTAGSE